MATENHVHFEEVLERINRIHKRMHRAIKAELARRNLTVLTSEQALILFRLGDQEMTQVQMRQLEHYQGGNSSYNVNKLTEQGFIERRTSKGDRRRIYLKTTEKGKAVAAIIHELWLRAETHGKSKNLKQALGVLTEVEMLLARVDASPD